MQIHCAFRQPSVTFRRSRNKNFSPRPGLDPHPTTRCQTPLTPHSPTAILRPTSGSSSVVECFLAKEDVAGSTPVSRSKKPLPARSFLDSSQAIAAAPPRRGTQVVRERSAKPLCVGSIPTRASILSGSSSLPHLWRHRLDRSSTVPFITTLLATGRLGLSSDLQKPATPPEHQRSRIPAFTSSPHRPHPAYGTKASPPHPLPDTLP